MCIFIGKSVDGAGRTRNIKMVKEIQAFLVQVCICTWHFI